MDGSHDIATVQTPGRTGRICRLRGNLPCAQPHLLCTACPYGEAARRIEKDAFYRPSALAALKDRLTAHAVIPYVKFIDPAGRAVVEVGIEGTF